MKDTSKSETQLLEELAALRQELAAARQQVEALRGAEEALAQERTLLRTLIDHFPDYIFIKDTESRFVTTNAAHLRTLGAETLAEVLGQTDFAFFPRELAEQYYADEQAVIRSGQPLVNREEAVIDQEGRERWLLTTKVPLHDRDGAIAGLVGISRDITDRKRTEEMLRASEARFKALYEGIPIPTYTWQHRGDDFILIYCNKVARENMQRMQAEFIGAKASDLYFRRQDILDDLRRCAAEGVVIKKEIISEHFLPGRNALITYAFIPPDLILVHMEDITERKRSEEALRASEERYRALLNNLPVGVYSRSLGTDNRLLDCNPALLGMFGYTAEEFMALGTGPTYVHPEERERFNEELARTGQAEGRELELRRKDGTTFWARVWSQLVSDEAGPRVEGILVDVTEHRRAEKLRIAKEAAESENRAKSLFLANMSHEIRTPLNAILGFAQILQRDPSLTPPQRQQLDTINRSGEHLLALINDVLEVSRIEADRTTLSRAPFDLHALLRDLEMMFRVRTEAKGLRLQVEWTDDVPQSVVGDQGKLRQVLINLIGNAVKFTETGGITVRVTRGEGRVTEEGNWEIRKLGSKAGAGCPVAQLPSCPVAYPSLRLVVEVEDTGVGIAADQISRIFDYFEQAGRGLQTGGTGLGLAISRAYVRLMGGDIAVRSEVGQGSVFRFEVVLEPAAPEPAVPAPAGRVLGLGPSQPPVRILVVDDQPVMRDLLTDLLVPLGFELREAASGEEALRQFEAWKPHLILMDLRMPGMDGYEATRRIRARAEGAEVPIIAVTASAFEENQQEILAAGANDFLAKPFRLSDLLEKMGAFLDVDVYAEAAPSPAEGPPDGGTTNVREALASLPGELVNSLRDAALRADLDRVLALVDQVEAHDARVAEELRRVAEQFDFRHLRDLLGGGA